MIKYINQSFVRYLMAGAFNTGVTYLLYLFFLLFVNYYIAYSLTYAIGIVISYYINSKFVFNAPLSLKKALQFPVVYIIQYLFGLLCLHLLVSKLSMNEHFAPIFVIMASIPLTYLLSRYILKAKA